MLVLYKRWKKYNEFQLTKNKMTCWSRGNPARGIVGRVTDCGVRDLGFKSSGSILTSRTEASSLSRVVRDGWDPCSVPLKWGKESHAVESSTRPLNSHNCSENYPKKQNKNLNNRKWKIIHPPPSEESHPVTGPLRKTVEVTGDSLSLINMNTIKINNGKIW